MMQHMPLFTISSQSTVHMLSRKDTQPTRFVHINIKYIWGPHGKPYGDPTLITYRDLQKVNTLNKYHFSIFFYYKETMKKLVSHIN